VNSNLRLATKVTLIGALGDAILGGLKVAIGIQTRSQSLLADGIHSFSDLITDGFVLFFTRYGSKAPDRDHPYGHGRIETFGTLLLGASLFFLGLMIGWDSIHRLIQKEYVKEVHTLSLFVVVFSIALKEGLFWYTLRAAKKIQSKLLEANAWHSRSDALSSLVVLIGLIFSYFGIVWMELVGAVFVALIISKMGISFVWDGMKELTDTGVDDEILHAIDEEIKTIKSIKGYHDLRSRYVSGKIFLDINIEVATDITVTEGHQIGVILSSKLRERIKIFMMSLFMWIPIKTLIHERSSILFL